MKKTTKLSLGLLGMSATLMAAVEAADKTSSSTKAISSDSSFQEETVADLPGFYDAVTDTLNGFGDTQHASGWQYGHLQMDGWPAGESVTEQLRPLERYEAGWWRRPESAP